jgi:hypothetical protein
MARCRLTESVINLPIKPQSVKHSLFLYEGSALFADLGPKCDILTHLWESSEVRLDLLIINDLQNYAA